MRRRKKIYHIPLLWGIAVAVLVAAVTGVGVAVYRNHEKMRKVVEIPTIYQGISVEDRDVSGKTKLEAFEALREVYTAHLSQETIRLVYQDREWKIPFAQLDVFYDIEKAAKDAWNIGREGELKQRYQVVQDLLVNPVDIGIEYTYDKSKILQELSGIEEEFKVDAQNSQLTRKNGTFVATDEKNGYEIDKVETAKKIISQLETKKGGDVEAVVKVIQPTVTKAENEKVKNLLGSFTTHYSANAEGRNENLRVGCKNINGTILASGDTFSMNQALGPQTYANGYQDAGIYVNGKVEQGVGGGVCQVTSTLYNAAIYAELDIVQRSPHSMTVGYVPLGRDAAVAGNYKDLRFRNNTDAPIYIEAYASNGSLVTKIYGHETRDSGRTLEFERVYDETVDKPAEKIIEDSELPEGERKVTARGRTGCKVTIYKKIFQNGKLVSREWFSSSAYRATPDEITVGTKKSGSETAVPANASEKKIVDQSQKTTNSSAQSPKTEPSSDTAASENTSDESNLPPLGSE